MKAHRAVRRLACLALAAGLTTTTLLASPGSAGAEPAKRVAAAERAASSPLRYVALGDSYSAASGVLPPDPTAAPQCLRSTRNYPHVIAARTGARLRDVTCGGADTTHYRTAQYPGVPPQLRALGRGTDLVTMTIGGNDSGVFINSIVACATAGIASLGRGNPCQQQNGSRFVDTIRERTFPSLVRALRDVHRRAPRARVAILGYPEILPPRIGCYPQMPVARGDVPYLHHLQDVLNNAVRRAARATGSVYVDVPRASRGHDSCRAIGVRWVEPGLLGTNPVIVHPNALGEAALARITMRRLGLR